jgi:hypothetical protein
VVVRELSAEMNISTLVRVREVDVENCTTSTFIVCVCVPWGRVPLEKLVVAEVIQEIPRL